VSQGDAPANLYRHVDGIFPDTGTLTESAEQVAAVEGHPGFQAIKALLHAEVEKIDRQLDSGPLKSAEDYAFVHGRRGALLSFEQAVPAIVERAKQRAEQAERDAAGESAAGR
jgi:hypothetical protein